eukprot:TRINITY_DN55126_c0_g1_i2.p2 TRINITY_DN55126_c0_g1~~TRINITY_DN55126_c0_g1_i2.p2  ORF type:complete len:220 (+),score=26.26 TRINITY_DN55126_c0_g1_i2:150-809(+)
MNVTPNQTIYVNNLYEKLNKEELKKCLYAMFSQFGSILDIVCLKTNKLRGQAWIVFADIASASNALRTMQGFPFMDKAIRIDYAKTKSDAVAKLDGTYKPGKREREKKTTTTSKETAPRQQKQKVQPQGQIQGPQPMDTEEIPNKILFVQNLPPQTNDRMLDMLFQQFPGFLEVRMVEARPGIAFVEFEDEAKATVAMNGLQNFQVTQNKPMKIAYAKQ